eukprot:TRINITY_DN28417_c0_g1_i1.p1 TRINITY_DN28417_c0_g1~~TRINITY_DN28417_c0_g1_i1.p1  ORF type:complete len:170 (-),score=37.68 TRINITY_DN28417_c0_g1_i1:439-948(-)
MLLQGSWSQDPVVSFVSRQHRANDPGCCSEARRVEREGGKLSSTGYREWRVYPGDRSERVSKSQGPGSLAVTRSLGHPELSKYGVTAIPEMEEIELEGGTFDFSIVLLLTDGITDVLSQSAICGAVSKFVEGPGSVDCGMLAGAIIDCAAAEESAHDDLTVVVLVVEHL